jgi:hypothetical protein
MMPNNNNEGPVKRSLIFFDNSIMDDDMPVSFSVLLVVVNIYLLIKSLCSK